MKRLSISLALVALALLGSYAWLGPVYTMHDGCQCGRRRDWKEFQECAPLRGKKFMPHVTSPGVPGHEHHYWDTQYSQSSLMALGALGVAMAALIVELRRRGLAPSAPALVLAVFAQCLTTQGAHPAHALDGGIPSLSNVGHHWPAASDQQCWADNMSTRL